jgi:hypothetical protein
MNAPWQARLAVELGARVLWDEGVEAARNACVAGASIAAAAISAAAYYDNPLTGIGALRACMSRLEALPLELPVWRAALGPRAYPELSAGEFSPGFGFVTPAQAEAVLEACRRLSADEPPRSAPRRSFWLEHNGQLSALTGPLNPAGLTALCFLDHGRDIEHAERLFLSWRTDTAVAEAQRARRAGLAAFPFLSDGFVYEGEWPAPPRPRDRAALLERLGLSDVAS